MTTAPPVPAPSVAVVRRPGSVRFLWLLVVLALLVALMAASVAVGSRGVGWSEIVAALGGSSETIGEAAVTVLVLAAVMALAPGLAAVDPRPLLTPPSPELVGALELRPVGPEVGNVANDRPELAERVDPDDPAEPETTTGTLFDNPA